MTGRGRALVALLALELLVWWVALARGDHGPLLCLSCGLLAGLLLAQRDGDHDRTRALLLRHLARSPWRALCGADEPGQSTLNVASPGGLAWAKAHAKRCGYELCSECVQRAG